MKSDDGLFSPCKWFWEDNVWNAVQGIPLRIKLFISDCRYILEKDVIWKVRVCDYFFVIYNYQNAKIVLSYANN